MPVKILIDGYRERAWNSMSRISAAVELVIGTSKGLALSN